MAQLKNRIIILVQPILSRVLLCVLLTLSTLSQVKAQNAPDSSLIFTEVMPSPFGGGTTNEYVELFNSSFTDSINVATFRYRAGTNAARDIRALETGGSVWLRPRSYAVLFANTYASGNRYYDQFIPQGTLLLRLDFTLALTDGGTTLRLIAANNDTVQSYMYGASTQNFSFEKIDLLSSNAPSNWARGLSANGTPGSKNSVSPRERDLGISMFRSLTGNSIVLGDSLLLSSVIRNFGTLNTSSFRVEMFNDRDSNSLLEPSERFYERTVTGILQAGDSLEERAGLRPSLSGIERLAAVVTLSGDEFRLNDTARITVTVTPPAGIDTSLIFTEVMPSPFGGGTTNEYVEVFNMSTTDSLNLSTFRYRAGNNSTGTISDTGNGGSVWLRPRSYAVIVPSTYLTGTVNNRYYNPFIPPGTVVVRLSRGLDLTDGGTTIRLISQANDTIQSFTYSGGVTQNVSLEKITLSRDNAATNWARALISGGTPGSINTRTPKDRDMALTQFSPSSSSIRRGTPMTLRLVARNFGRLTASNVEVEIFEDRDSNTIASQSERIFNQTIAQLSASDSLTFTTSVETPNGGVRRFIAAVTLLEDEARLNDSLHTSFSIFVPNDADTNMIFSEVMYDPPADANSTAHEFVELFNASVTDTLDLGGWRYRAGTNAPISLSDTGDGRSKIPPQTYAVIVPNSYFTNERYYNRRVPENTFFIGATGSLSLTNSGTTIRLITPIGDTVQSYTYTGNIPKGFTFEKVLLTRDNSIINWGRSQLQGGTPGAINSITPKERDMSINSVVLFPSANVRVGTNSSLRVTVRNVGLTRADTFQVAVYNDLDSNDVATQNELIAVRNTPFSLTSFDSLAFDFTISTDGPGLRRFITAVTQPGDQLPLNDSARILFNVFAPNLADTNIILSEVMYDPPADANSSTFDEFLELHNTSDSESIDIRGWRIGGTVNLVLSDSGGGQNPVIVPPKGYAIIFAPNYYTSPQYYRELIPSNAVYARASGALNLSNTADSITVVSAQGDLMATMSYVGDSRNKGRSLEKVFMTRDDQASNFRPSLREAGSPGRDNSVTPKPFDLAISVAAQFSTPPRTSITIPYRIVNRGLNAFGAGAILRVFEDKNDNRIAEEDEEILEARQTLTSALAPFDSLGRSVVFAPRNFNPVTLLMRLEAPGDNDTLNNRATVLLLIGTPRNAIVINEILYQPIQSSTDFRPDQPDYVELYNRSDTAIDLRGWYLTNQPNERGEFDRYFFASEEGENYILKPGQYAVVSPDRAKSLDSTRLVLFYSYLQRDTTARLFYVRTRSTFSNSTSGGLVQLVDNTNGVVDSVAYSPRWHNTFISNARGISLERINYNLPSNDSRSWTSSSNREFGGTPGKRNAAFAQTLSGLAQGSMDIAPNPFSPDGDGRDDNTIISFSLPDQVNRVRIKIYDSRGRLVRTLSNSEPTSSQGSMAWDGLGENRESLRIGIYIVYLEALGANSALVTALKKTIVLARPLR